jgi:hypothetical protein
VLHRPVEFTAKSCLSPLPTCAATIGGRSLNLSLCQLSLG